VKRLAPIASAYLAISGQQRCQYDAARQTVLHAER
jgi:hypothetical protein